MARFNELCAVLEPGKPPKADKVAILSDAARLLEQLRAEAEKLKTSNESLQDSIKSLKVNTKTLHWHTRISFIGEKTSEILMVHCDCSQRSRSCETRRRS
jgi:hypothetical protein